MRSDDPRYRVERPPRMRRDPILPFETRMLLGIIAGIIAAVVSWWLGLHPVLWYANAVIATSIVVTVGGYTR